jgi:hypothetical protein
LKFGKTLLYLQPFAGGPIAWIWLIDDLASTREQSEFIGQPAALDDPLPTFDPARVRRQLPKYNGRSVEHIGRLKVGHSGHSCGAIRMTGIRQVIDFGDVSRCIADSRAAIGEACNGDFKVARPGETRVLLDQPEPRSDWPHSSVMNHRSL